MKSDREIQDFIDSKEVLTIRELMVFMYPYTSTSYAGSGERPIVKKWWDYVLKTKDWAKLKEYKEHKIRDWNLNTERFKKFTELYNTDKRIKEWGSRRLKDYLLKTYGITIARSSIQQYKKRLKCTAEKNSKNFPNFSSGTLKESPNRSRGTKTRTKTC